jgi:hypothetical protein
MEYIGNFAEWIDDTVIEQILIFPGDRRPKKEHSQYESLVEQKWRAAGFDTNRLGWEIYFDEHLQIPNLDLPIDPASKKFKWWYTKLLPGDLFPLHIDVYPENRENIERYWLACEDYRPGHIFINENVVLDQYKKGDMYKFDDPKSWHAAANIGFTPKISYQLVLYD